MLQDEPLIEFIMLAEDIMQANFAPTLLGLASMMLMTRYQHFLDILGHFNTPWLYGECMTGKTLAATCIAYITGCPRDQIVCRFVQMHCFPQQILTKFYIIKNQGISSSKEKCCQNKLKYKEQLPRKVTRLITCLIPYS